MGKHTPTARQRRLVALWRDSTLSMAVFARAHGVRPRTFRAWVARHALKAVEPPSVRSFVQVVSIPVAPAPSAFVVYVDQHALSFESPPPPAWFAAVLNELVRC